MAKTAKIYTSGYYEKNVNSPAFASASQIIPFLVRHLAPKSLLELGAANGTWSRVALEAGITDILAVDGTWVNPNALCVPGEKFMFHDLTRPFVISRKFDLALCLEVGEHLDSSAAETLVDSLTRHAAVVVFGAAMPFQGGTLHINEQWPAYWKKKFEVRGYHAVDIIRPAFWNNPNVAYYYKQNTFVYCQSSTQGDLIVKLQEDCQESYRSSADFVFIHPDKYAQMGGFENVNVKLMLKRTPRLVTKVLVNKIARFVEAISILFRRIVGLHQVHKSMLDKRSSD